MAGFESVNSFLELVPDAMQHEEVYRRAVAASTEKGLTGIDLAVWESACLGIGEHNLLRDLPISDKFILDGMDSSLKIRSQSLAKQKEKELFGKGSLTGDKVYTESYTMDKVIELEASTIDVDNSGRPGVQIPDNDPLYSQLSSGLAGISSAFLTSMTVGLIGEKLTIRHDMRHVLLKGYLLLMSYNLAVTSGAKRYKKSKVYMPIRKNVSAYQKLVMMTERRIVVNAKAFSKDELWLLAEIAGSYPKRQWDGGNIYSNIFLAEDDIIFYTEVGAKDPPSDEGLGSPERLWKNLLSIAAKFNALEDLKEVVRSFRGIPGIMRSVMNWSGRFKFGLEYPLSYSVNLAVEGMGFLGTFSTRDSNYFATSKCLVADLMLSKMMEMSMYNIIEESGCLGYVGCPTGKATSDGFLISTMKSYGLHKDDESVNMLLQEWRGVKGCSIDVVFCGRLREAVTRMAASIRSGDTSFLRPQLLYSLPYSNCRNTTWGLIRGWKFSNRVITDTAKSRISDNQLIKGYTWVMGVSTDVPKLGLNSLGVTLMERLSLEESKFVQCANGTYEIGLVRHIIEGNPKPRTDEFELGARSFYQSNFPGTRCTVVFDKDGVPRIFVDEPETRKDAEDTLGVGVKHTDNEGSYRVGMASFGGSAVEMEISNGLNKDRVVELVQDKRPTRRNNFRERASNQRHRYQKGPEEDEGLEQEEEVRSTRFQRGRGSRGRGAGRGVGGRAPQITVGGRGAQRETDKNTSTVDGVRKRFDRVDKNGRNGDKNDTAKEKEKGKEKETETVVQLKEKGVLEVNYNPRIRTRGGKEVGVMVEAESGPVELVLELNTEPVPEDAVRGYLVNVPGDGKCGVHAIVEDMRARRMVREDEIDDTYENTLSEMVSTGYHDMAELAAYCADRGMGLIVIDVDNKEMINYGTKDPSHIIYLYYKDMHYKTFIPHPKGPKILEGFKYVYDDITPEDTARGLEIAMKLHNSSQLDAERARLGVGRNKNKDTNRRNYRM